MSFVIVKYVKPRVPVILLDSQGEVWEFNERDEADMYAEIFEANSDSGYKYVVKAVGESLDLED